MALELTTVADDEVVFFDGPHVRRYQGLEPDTEYLLEGETVRTLPRPPGARLVTVATVNDLHLGETECGRLDGYEGGPVLTSEPGETPYPLVMSRAAAAEIAARAPDTVVVKGDLTARGRPEELAAFLDCFGVFAPRLHWVRGNHDVARGAQVPSGGPAEVCLPGVRLALVDTSVPGAPGGDLGDDQLEWLDELGARSDRPVLVFGHHPVADLPAVRASGNSISPEASMRLVEVFARRPALAGYFAGHTHRNRVTRHPATGEVPWAEVAATKDFPGGWAEYRVYEGGILQVFHRLSSPEALSWSERTRAMFGGLYPGYAFGALSDRCFAVRPRVGAGVSPR